MRGVNKVILIGHCGQDPEVKYMPSGGAFSTLSVATTETWKDKQAGQPQERTEWHRVVFFNRLAEIVGEYVRKGSKIYIEGSLTTRKWQDQSGQDRYTTEIKAANMQMLDSLPQQSQPQQNYSQPQGGYPQNGQPQQRQQGGYPQNGDQAAQQQRQPPQQSQRPQANRQQQQQTPPPENAGFDNFDDDIPF